MVSDEIVREVYVILKYEHTCGTSIQKQFTGASSEMAWSVKSDVLRQEQLLNVSAIFNCLECFTGKEISLYMLNLR